MSYSITIDDVFEIKDRGIVVIGQYPAHRIFIKAGDNISICNPDGTIFETRIIGIEHFNRRSITDKLDRPFGFLLKNIIKDQIQKGAIIKPVDLKETI